MEILDPWTVTLGTGAITVRSWHVLLFLFCNRTGYSIVRRMQNGKLSREEENVKKDSILPFLGRLP
jgi:hypothetical protein